MKQRSYGRRRAACGGLNWAPVFVVRKKHGRLQSWQLYGVEPYDKEDRNRLLAHLALNSVFGKFGGGLLLPDAPEWVKRSTARALVERSEQSIIEPKVET